MFNSALSSAVKAQPLTDAPVARKVIFEIGVILVAHLVLALAVGAVLGAFGEF